MRRNLEKNILNTQLTFWKLRLPTLVLITGILLMIAVNLSASFALWRGRADTLSDWTRFMSSMGTLAIEHADQSVAAADTLLSRITDRVHRARPEDSAALKKLFGTQSISEELRDYKLLLPQVDVVSIVDIEGNIINFSRGFPAPPINLADRDYYKAHKAGTAPGLFLSQAVRNKGTGKWTFYLSKPILDPKGKMLGLVLVGLNCDYWGGFFQSLHLQGNEPSLMLTRRDGSVLARFPADDKLMGKTLRGTGYRILESGTGGTVVTTGPRVSNPLDSQERIVTAKASSKYPMAMNLVVTETLYMANWHKVAKQIGYSALLLNIILLVAMYLICRLLRRRDRAEAELRASLNELAIADKRLTHANEDLERRVAKRTEMLSTANASLGRELNERQLVEQKLEKLARYDPLTGLPNRSLFAQQLDQALIQDKGTDKLVGLMFIDLDHFKSVNDSYGHDVGDLVLQEAGTRMRALLRHSDIVSRMGGDEFTVIIDDVYELEEFHVIAKKLVDGFAPPLVVGNRELFLTLSVGLAVAPAESQSGGQLMKQADLAMYCAKAAGRNGYRVHSASMEEAMQERTAVEQALRHALERNEFELEYQVRVSSTSRKLVGLEALLRWNNPQLGLVSPAEFIPIAEDTGLIVELGNWVLRTACAQYVKWCEEGLDPGVIAVNVSPRQFRQSEFAQMAARITRESGIRPECIELEVTESLLMSDPELAQSQMAQLRKLGFGIAIDDFGTGYSSLSHLKTFPATKLKIDRAFVSDIDTNVQDQAIASAIVAMAKSLSMTVTAEGVETLSQIEQLQHIACDEYQGYLFGRPAGVKGIREILPKRVCADVLAD